MASTKDNQEDKEKPIDRTEYERLKLIFSSIPAELAYWLDHMNSPVRVVRRDFKDFFGQFLGFGAEITFIEIGVIDETKDYTTNVITRETKVVRLPISSLTNLEWIIDTEQIKPEEKQ